jgi:hypothetical protein
VFNLVAFKINTSKNVSIDVFLPTAIIVHLKKKVGDNFIKGYQTILRFDRRVLNYHFSRTRGFNYQNEFQKDIPSVLGVKT